MSIKKEFNKFIEDYKISGAAYSSDFINKLKSFKYICVWGTGEQANKIISIVRNSINIDFICDNNPDKWGKIFWEKKCLSPIELEQYKRDVVIIVTTGYHIDIVKQLKDDGYANIEVLLSLLAFKNNLRYCSSSKKLEQLQYNIGCLFDICADYRSKKIVFELIKNWFQNQNPDKTSYRNLCLNEQYFDKDIIHYDNSETYVDIGAWDGDTIFSFLRNRQNKFQKIHAFELDRLNYQKLQKNIDLLDSCVKNKIILYNMGIWDKQDTIYYNEWNTGSKIDNLENGVEGHVDSLDHILSEENITFVKMDIEGAEIQALQGMKNIIQMKKPKMAVCVYHEPEHLWEVPLFLKQLVPEYKIYIRHYSMDEYETVCYAII